MTVAQGSRRLDIVAVASDARDLRWRKFVRAWAGEFLLARLDAAEDGVDDAQPLGFDTVGISLESPPDPIAHDWMLYTLDCPDADPDVRPRLSVGRAPGCDLVMRFSFVSKMHAYIEPQVGGGAIVGDHRSVNGTWVDGEQVGPGARIALPVGGRVRFGLLTLRLVDGKQLHEALNSDGFAAWKAQL